MNLNDIQFIFNRAWSLTFDKKKLLAVFITLLLCGLLVVFFRGLALNAGHWVTLSLTFLPLFLCSGVLLSLGIFLVRIYHDELKNKAVSYSDILNKSWDLIIGTTYLSIPIILSYLLLWMLLGVFFLLNQIPSVGNIFGVILAFAPFLLNLGALVLCVLSVSMLFFVTPAVALRGFNRIRLAQLLSRRFQENSFLSLMLATIAALPLLIFFGLALLAAFLTGAICFTCSDPLYVVLQSFFMMIPFAAAMAPGVIFFFNFAAESHVSLQKQEK